MEKIGIFPQFLGIFQPNLLATVQRTESKKVIQNPCCKNLLAQCYRPTLPVINSRDLRLLQILFERSMGLERTESKKAFQNPIACPKLKKKLKGNLIPIGYLRELSRMTPEPWGFRVAVWETRWLSGTGVPAASGSLRLVACRGGIYCGKCNNEIDLMRSTNC